MLFLNGTQCYAEIDVIGLQHFSWCELFFLELILQLHIKNVPVNLVGGVLVVRRQIMRIKSRVQSL